MYILIYIYISIYIDIPYWLFPIGYSHRGEAVSKSSHDYMRIRYGPWLGWYLLMAHGADPSIAFVSDMAALARPYSNRKFHIIDPSKWLTLYLF